MGVLRLIIAAVLVSGALLAFGGASETALAGEAVVGSAGYTCDQGGLASAINAAATNDPNNPGVVTFDCDDNKIDFDSQITFGSGGPLPDRAVIIDGSNGGNQIVFDGGNSTRFFNVRFRGYLTLQNISMQFGKSSEYGGAINNVSGELTVIQSSFTNNHAVYDGGAIRISGGTATIIQSTFTTNSAGNGGAIYGYPSTVTVDQSVFESNTASNSGGAIYNASKMTIYDSVFKNNSANGTGGAGGGAIYTSENVGNLTIERSSFIENTALSLNAFGGAIGNSNGKLTITESRFERNEATAGGAISQSSSGVTVVNRSTFVGNKAIYREAGAIHVWSGTMSVVASTLTGNVSGTIGSTMYVNYGATALLAWSTIIQPENTVPAFYLYTNSNLNLQGVILGGSGTHCQFAGGTLSDSYSLSNDDSCGIDGTGSSEVTAADGVSEFGLGTTTSAMVNGVLQTFYPLLTTGPALNGPATCDSGKVPDADPELDQLGNVRPFPEGGTCTIGAIQVNNLPPVIQMVSEPPLEIDEGGTIRIEFGDPNNGDSFDYELDCDTSSGTSDQIGRDDASVSYGCTYPDNGQFSGKATANDASATTTLPFTVTVNNVAPIMGGIGIAGPSLMSTNQAVSVLLFASDVPADQITFMMSCDGVSAPIAVGPIASASHSFSGNASCSYAVSGFYTVNAYAMDDDGGVSEVLTSSTTLQVVDPTLLCVQRGNGAVRVSDSCSRSESQIILPQDGSATMCVNQWNGAARVGSNCSRSEYSITVYGDQTVSACVNKWNGSLRVGGNCSRSEQQVWL